MDQSQMPAQPTPEMSARDLVATLSEAEPVIEGNAKDNQQHAARELEMITELLSSRAFEWFEAEFIGKPYATAFASLRSKHTRPEDLPGIQQTYIALREIKAGMIERELAHRELISPADPRNTFLRSKLDAL